MAETYPNLERMLKMFVVGDYFRWFRRPEKWAEFIGLGVIVYFIADAQYGMAALALLAKLALEYLLIGARIKSFKLKDQNAENFKEILPRKLKQELKRGRLTSMIGEEAVSLLEECARSAHEVTVNCVEGRMLKTGVSAEYVSAQDEAGKAAETLMRRALMTVQRQVIYRAETGEQDVRKLSRSLEDLHKLEIDSRALAELAERGEDDQGLKDSLAHMRALQDAVEEVESISE